MIDRRICFLFFLSPSPSFPQTFSCPLLTMAPPPLHLHLHQAIDQLNWLSHIASKYLKCTSRWSQPIIWLHHTRYWQMVAVVMAVVVSDLLPINHCTWSIRGQWSDLTMKSMNDCWRRLNSESSAVMEDRWWIGWRNQSSPASPASIGTVTSRCTTLFHPLLQVVVAIERRSFARRRSAAGHRRAWPSAPLLTSTVTAPLSCWPGPWWRSQAADSDSRTVDHNQQLPLCHRRWHSSQRQSSPHLRRRTRRSTTAPGTMSSWADGDRSLRRRPSLALQRLPLHCSATTQVVARNWHPQ